ncbi:hypothetical protein DERF_000648 [Dermatophagoides farinae]|uniref:alpha-glucosidase n=1 Tax=Dermatophagoides farinae TaxID=6954 RepID=A0A922I9B2_DERFA|nr:hypothetical protein DERF_000648 [Dermatophagoides farinae]
MNVTNNLDFVGGGGDDDDDIICIKSSKSSIQTKGVSFLEYVEVSGDNDCDDNNVNKCNINIENNGDDCNVQQTSIIRSSPSSIDMQQSSSSSSIHYHRSINNGQFHYEPLRPPAISSPLESISSTDNSNSSPSSLLSPLVSLDYHHHHHQHHNPHHLANINATMHNPQMTQQYDSNIVNNMIQDRPSVIYKPVRSLIQYWPESHPHIPLSLPQNQYDAHPLDQQQQQQINQSSLLLHQSSICDTQILSMNSNNNINNNNNNVPMLLDHLISKSSSSDSDTNDSGTRLISDSYNDLIISASDTITTATTTNTTTATTTTTTINNNQNNHHVYLTSMNQIDTIVENHEPESMNLSSSSTAMNENNPNDLWIQVQGDLSKNLREKYLQNQSANNLDSVTNNNNNNSSSNNNNNNNSSSNRRKKNFQKFRRIGFERFGFNCPLSHRMTRIIIWSSITVCLSITLLIIWFSFLRYHHHHHHGGLWWLPRWLFGSTTTTNHYYQTRRYQFDQDPYWYHGTTFYEIFPASFKDSDGDGYGDFMGIVERVDYLRSLGINAIRLNSIFAAFDYPRYYDNVLNFYDVDPHLGNFQSFFKMIQVLHSNQIRVILELNPTITSDEHPWSMNRTTEYENYYYHHHSRRKSATTNKKNVKVTPPPPPPAITTTMTQQKKKKTNTNDDDDVHHQHNYHHHHRRFDNLAANDNNGNDDDDDEGTPPGGRWLNWNNEAIPKHMLKVADFWLRYVDGLYLKNLEKIHVDFDGDDDNDNGNDNGDNIALSDSMMKKRREKILLDFLQRLRRIFDYHDQLYAKTNKITEMIKIPKKILICSSHLLSPLLSSVTAAKRRRRRRRQQHQQQHQQQQTMFNGNNYSPSMPLHNNKQNEFRPEFDELDMNDFFDPTESTTISDEEDGYPKILANSHKMLPSSSSISSASKSLNHSLFSSSILNHQQQRNSITTTTTTNFNNKSLIIKSSIRSIYHYFDLVHFELKLQPNRIDNIRDQMNYVFLNRPLDFPPIMWSIGGSTKHKRLVNRMNGTNYSLASLFVLAMMPGTISIFYGDEIGLSNVYDFRSHNVFIGSQLCPMAWSSESPNGNFSLPNVSTSSWLPIHPDYTHINVEKRSEMVKIVAELINFRLDFLYIDDLETKSLNQNQQFSTSSNNQNNKKNLLTKESKSSILNHRINYLFHYIDQTTIVLEQYFDRINPSKSSTMITTVDNHHRLMAGDDIDVLSKYKRYRYVVFANLGNETIVRDFSDKFHFSIIQMATNINRTSEFLIMKSLQLDPGEAMIVTVE